jgi:hypothetical protein
MTSTERHPLNRPRARARPRARSAARVDTPE